MAEIDQAATQLNNEITFEDDEAVAFPVQQQVTFEGEGLTPLDQERPLYRPDESAQVISVAKSLSTQPEATEEVASRIAMQGGSTSVFKDEAQRLVTEDAEGGAYTSMLEAAQGPDDFLQRLEFIKKDANLYLKTGGDLDAMKRVMEAAVDTVAAQDPNAVLRQDYEGRAAKLGDVARALAYRQDSPENEEDAPGFLDYAQNLILQALSETVTTGIAAGKGVEQLGEDAFLPSKNYLAERYAEWSIGRTPEEAAQKVMDIADNIEKSGGWFGGANKALLQEVVGQMVSGEIYDSESFTRALDALNIPIGTFAASATKASARLKNLGKPANALGAAGGQEVVAGAVTRELVTGTNTLKLTPTEKADMLLSGARGRLEELGTTKGLHGAIMNNLHKNLDEIVKQYEALVQSGARLPEEVEAFANYVRHEFDPNYNPAINTSKILSLDSSGAKIEAYWQGADGLHFRTMEDAQNFAKTRPGITEVIKAPDNPGFLVREQELVEMVARRDELVKELGQAAKTPTKSERLVELETKSGEIENAIKDTGATKDKIKDLKAELKVVKEQVKTEKANPTKSPSYAAKVKELNDLDSEIAAAKHAMSTQNGNGGFMVREVFDEAAGLGFVGRTPERELNISGLGITDQQRTTATTYQTRLLGMFSQGRLRNELTKFWDSGMKGLSKTDRRAVEKLLEKGDAYSNNGGFGKEFTMDEIMAQLGDNPNAMKIAEGYYTVRMLRNITHNLMDSELTRSLKAKGFKHVTMEVVGADGVALEIAGVARTVSDDAALLGKRFYDAVEGKGHRMTEEMLQQYKANGWRFVKFDEEVAITGEGDRTLFAVPPAKSSIGEIKQALPYRPGEMSRMYSDEYIIRVKGTHMVDDATAEFDKAIATAASRTEADEFVTRYNQMVKAIQKKRAGVGGVNRADVAKYVGSEMDIDEVVKRANEGAYDNITAAEVKFTRTEDDFMEYHQRVVSGQSRQLRGMRGQRLMEVGAKRNTTLSPFESMQAEINNVARFVNINQWREDSIVRWHNTYKELIPNATDDAFNDFFEFKKELVTADKPRLVRMVNDRNYIITQIGLPTWGERKLEGYLRYISELIDVRMKGGTWIGRQIRQADPVGFIRALNFHLYLGTNPAQILVQAQGAINAVAVSPIHGLKAAMSMPLLAKMLATDNIEVLKMLRKETTREMGATGSDLERTSRMILRSGILDNIYSSSMYGREGGSLNVNNIPIFGLIAKGAKLPFNFGESAARLMSFDIARREFIAANPGVVWDSDDALKQIVARMDKYTMGMTKANSSFMQRGLMAVPSQFLSYNVHFMETWTKSILFSQAQLRARIKGRPVQETPDNLFTGKEAAAILTTHLITYGAAGNGFLWIADQVFGDQEWYQNAGSNLLLGIRQGLMAAAVAVIGEQLTGERTHIALGERLGVFSSLNSLAEHIYTNDLGFIDTLFGPANGFGTKIRGLASIAALWVTNPDVDGQTVRTMLSQWGLKLFSGMSNMEKAHAIEVMDGYLYRGGQASVKYSGPETTWMYFGFKNEEEAELWRNKAKRDKIENKFKNLGAVKRIIDREYLLEIHKPENEQDQDKIQSLWTAKNAILKSVGPSGIPTLRKYAGEGPILGGTQSEKMKKYLSDYELGQEYYGATK